MKLKQWTVAALTTLCLISGIRPAQAQKYWGGEPEVRTFSFYSNVGNPYIHTIEVKSGYTTDSVGRTEAAVYFNSGYCDWGDLYYTVSLILTNGDGYQLAKTTSFYPEENGEDLMYLFVWDQNLKPIHVDIEVTSSCQ